MQQSLASNSTKFIQMLVCEFFRITKYINQAALNIWFYGKAIVLKKRHSWDIMADSN